MTASESAFLLLGLFAGLVLAGAAFLWAGRRRIDEALAVGRREREPELVALQRDLAAALAQLAEGRERFASLEGAVEASRREWAAAEATSSELRARLEEQQRGHAEKQQLLMQAEARLSETFQNLATRIVDERANRFSEQSQQQLGGLLNPLKDQLKEFREAVTLTHATEQRERGMLSQEIQSLKQLNERISQDAINLTRALKGDSQKQGAWGEMVLERVLEASGLQAGREFEIQASFQDEFGGRPRPDVVVHLPEEKDLVIDAKVSLVAYERYCSAEDELARAAALRDHVASMKRHIDGLAARGYTDLPGLRTLDFVLLFVPVEAAFIEAVRADDGLYAYALARNISLVSPSTLLATLRTVAYLWRIERRNVNALEIARRGAMLHDNFALLIGELDSIGGQLDKAQKCHASAIRRLTEGGKGSVILQVQSLAEMGAPTKKVMPARLLNAAGASDQVLLDAAAGLDGDAGSDPEAETPDDGGNPSA